MRRPGARVKMLRREEAAKTRRLIGLRWAARRRGSRFSCWPSFLDGIARTLDMGATYTPRPAPQTDVQALADDWRKVGQDLASVMGLREVGR